MTYLCVDHPIYNTSDSVFGGALLPCSDTLSAASVGVTTATPPKDRVSTNDIAGFRILLSAYRIRRLFPEPP